MRKHHASLFVILMAFVFIALSVPSLVLAEGYSAVIAEIAGMPDNQSTAKWCAGHPVASEAVFADIVWLDVHPAVADFILK